MRTRKQWIAGGPTLALVTVLTGLATGATAQEARWTDAWGAAQMRVDGPDDDRITATGPATVRQVVHLSAGGRRIRVRLSNVAGDAPLTIGAASVAYGVPGQAAVTGVRPLTFAGEPSIVIAPGAEVFADDVDGFDVRPGSDLAVSLYLPSPAAHRTGHPGARTTTFLTAGGDATLRADLPDAQRIGGWWDLADVEVGGGAQTGTVVAIGDSITDGHGIRDDSNTRWPDVLATRLAPTGLTVVNAGIGGNRVLLDGLGPNLLARFDRDVIARPGVRYAIVLEGVNDLGVLSRDHPVDAGRHRAIVAAITGAYRQLAMRAHEHGIRLIGGTITPYGGSDYYHPGPDSEADRQAINAFIRSSGVFDGVIDFDRTVRDPAHPDRLLAAFDSGDHLHPGEAGYRAMAEAIPLSVFAASASPSAIGAAPSAPAGSVAYPRIALTFDDLPAHGPLPPGDDRLRIAHRIIDALAAHHAPASGFMNGGFGADDPQSPSVLAAWHAAGLPIGNHTFDHVNLDQVGAPAFLADVRRNELPLAAVAGAGDWHWFRFPFLAEGSTRAARAAVRARLRTDGYRIAAVTMSFGDYAWNDAFARCVAKADGEAIMGLETSYLSAARIQALRSRDLANAALGHDIPYVLLMHLGAFDARMLPRLLSMYEGMGFAFTTLAAAEADPFYATATDIAQPGPSPTLEAVAADHHVPIPDNAPLPAATICR